MSACECGCGGTPKSPRSRFLPGHDARVHGGIGAAQYAPVDPAKLRASRGPDGSPVSVPALVDGLCPVCRLAPFHGMWDHWFASHEDRATGKRFRD